jgi:hypothetical protein
VNGYQTAKLIQGALQARKWKGESGNELVFKRVRITPVDIETMLGVGAPGSPVCKINLGKRQSDQQQKGFVAQEIVVTLAVQVEGDELAENAMVGANRTAGSGSSKGRGILEVEAEMFAVLGDMNAMAGMQVQGYASGSVEVARVSMASSFVYCSYTFLFYCTTQLTYLGPTSLVASGSTGGTISLTWKPAPLIWSSISASGGQIIKYASGSTPPPTHDSGTDGPAVTGTATSASIPGLSSGTYAVSIFTAYKESGASSGADAWSPPTSYVVSVP